ncbi:hypothetical protein D0Z07_7765 [Hyphodiscus hymeniophilus]|uniref:GPI anchored serine-threonine rich protein n=1 Tax=Hyphodiscus hymeniophilus TaxID=353542 RepID=A0A9P6SQY7_9HELO|nr:hypothetical protein D0Z07_7765 [Hyphodiscus hymeniophilus]
MYISLLPVSLLLSLTAAQITTTQSVKSATSAAPGTSICAAQPVLEACLASTQAIAAGCSSTDYQCLCEQYNNILTCFNDCPNDPRYSSVLSSQETYCNDMSVYPSSTTTAISRPVSSSGSAATTTEPNSAQITGSAGAVQTASSTSSGASSSETGKNGAGRSIIIGTGQLVLGLAGVMGVLL